jgi:hypothetical protein
VPKGQQEGHAEDDLEQPRLVGQPLLVVLDLGVYAVVELRAGVGLEVGIEVGVAVPEEGVEGLCIVSEALHPQPLQLLHLVRPNVDPLRKQNGVVVGHEELEAFFERGQPILEEGECPEREEMRQQEEQDSVDRQREVDRPLLPLPPLLL